MYNLLIVDDKDVFRRMITRMPYFKNNHAKFRIKNLARNGLEALDLLNTDAFDVVLTDIRMPLMNGIDLLKKINKDKLCKCVILLSQYSEFHYAKEGIINGAFDYIVKPVDDEKIKAAFDRAYYHLQSFADKNDMLFNSVVKLAGSAITENDGLLLSALNIASKYIKQSCGSFAEMQLTVSNILERLHYHIELELTYAAQYIPLEKICALNRPVQDERELIELFNAKVVLLHKALAKFRHVSSYCLINKICSYIISDIENISTLQNTAEKFYINKKYLSTLFKKETGIRYVDFVTYFKIERAKMLLSYSDFKIYNVAGVLGFTDTEYFSKVFKKQTGSTPSSFDWSRYIADYETRALKGLK